MITSKECWWNRHAPINRQRMIRMIKAEVRKRDDYKCVDCGAKRLPGEPSLDVHRIVPGGEYSFENCETLCRACHGKKPKRLAGGSAVSHGTILDLVYPYAF